MSACVLMHGCVSVSVTLVVALVVVACGLVAAEPEPLHRCAAFSNLTLYPERPMKNVTVHGRPYNVTLYWSGGPTRVFAELLLVLARDVLGYSGVSLQAGPRSLCDLRIPDNELAVVSAAVLPQPVSCDLANAGLDMLGEAAAPLHLRLYTRLSRAAQVRAGCTIASTYIFYGNESALRDCGFLENVAELNELSALVPPLASQEEETALRALTHRLGVPVRRERVSRANLTRLLLSGERSILFVDYKLWPNLTGIHLVRLPGADSDARVSTVLAASEALGTFAPMFRDLIMNLSVTPDELRELLEERELRDRWEQVLCEHAEARALRLPRKRHDYWIGFLVCTDDPDRSLYHNIAYKVGTWFWNITQRRGYGIGIRKFLIECTQRIATSIRLVKIRGSSDWYRCAGVVVPAEGFELAAEFAPQTYLPIVVYGVLGDVIPDAGAPAGTAAQLARVLREFIAQRGWERLAVVSEQSAPARALMSELRAGNRPFLREKQLGPGTNSSEALLTLVKARGRIFLVNGGWRTARLVISEAARLGLTADRGYAWLALEWRGAGPPAGLRLFTISFQCNTTASFADAVLSLGEAFTELIQHTPHFQDDLRQPDAYSEFLRRFDSINGTGFCQPSLRYRNGALVAPLVFLTDLNGNASQRLGVWTVRGNTTEPLVPTPDPYAGGHAPHDGRIPCLWTRGDEFAPECIDRMLLGWTVALVFVTATISTAIWILKRRADRRRTLSLLSEESQKRTQRERIVSTLIDKLVNRDTLEVREEIGSGRFGHVRLAVLRVPGRRARVLAAKALHEDAAPAEESEFLREACTLATLEHEHVVRLVGICATGGPPLVLMEHAFFGDLLQYLRARRHFVEYGAEPADIEAAEARHVSAGELTRLAREAASALGYLAHRGLVHRDVRAANCLVDARRTLKLGDFGMAREMCPKGVEGEAEYACQRRGMFPVLWMAPESLSRGAFSAASDVWAYGVLAFEVITLGERPYGAWPPPRVLHHVLGGGRPRLPAEASAQARGFLLACWRHRVSERPTAAELVAYLADHPRVLAPSLMPLDELGSVDSGFCESSPPETATHNTVELYYDN